MLRTGYTAAAMDENLTFSQFARRCALQFGACAHLRDSNVKEAPDVVEVNSYYHRELDDAKAELKRLSEMTDVQIFDVFGKKCAEEVESVKAAAEKHKREGAILFRLIDEISAWTPDADHIKLKEFMLEQCISSFGWSVKTAEAAKAAFAEELKVLDGRISDALAAKPKSKYREALEYAYERVDRAAESLQKEIESCERATKWLQGLPK